MRTIQTLALTMLCALSLAAPVTAVLSLPDGHLTTETMSDGSSEDRTYPIEDLTYQVPADHSNLIVSAADLLSGDVPIIVCWLNPDGDDICGEDDLIAYGCGTLALFGAPWSGGVAQASVPTLLVTDDLNTCMSTAGTLTFSSW